MNVKILMAVALVLIVLAIALSLFKRHRSASSQLNIDDLLLDDNGKLSKAAAVMMGSFACTTWVVVYLALTTKLTEGYFAAYVAAWVAPSVTKLIINRPTSVVAITETSTVSTSKTATPT